MKLELLKDDRIRKFIENVEKMLYVEEQSSSIKDELLDHIECLVDDYIEAGYSYDEAVSKSLYSMGDPKEIGYSFADYDLMKRRKYTLFGLKSSSILVMLGLLVLSFINSKNGNSSESSVTSLLPLMINLLNVSFAGSTSGYIFGYSTRLVDLDTSPNLIQKGDFLGSI